VRTPIQVPEANGIAERFVRTVRSDCLDWLLILNASHLEHALTVFISHYNGFRPHRATGSRTAEWSHADSDLETYAADDGNTSRSIGRALATSTSALRESKSNLFTL
jgi:hypothetical protein